MRYIYYVVAALIFLVVVNLASRLIGNDTQELLSDLNPDQPASTQTGESIVEPTDEPTDEAATATVAPVATPPVAKLEESQAQAAIQTPATADASTTAVISDTKGNSHAPAPQESGQNAINTQLEAASNTAESSLAAVSEATQESAKEEVQPLIDKAAEATATISSAAATPAAAQSSVTQSPITQSSVAPDSIEQDVAAQDVVRQDAATQDPAKQKVATPEAASLENAAVAQAADAAPARAQADAEQAAAPAQALVAPEGTSGPAEPTDTTSDTAATTTSTTKPTTTSTSQEATPAMATTAAVPAAAQTDKPSLIQSLGDSAGSAATAVVGGAQQAVETVVEAARSLIEPDKTDTAGELAASTPDAPTTLATDEAKDLTDQTQTNTRSNSTAVAVVAAAVADAAQAEKKLTAAPTAESTAKIAEQTIAEQTTAEPSTTATVEPTSNQSTTSPLAGGDKTAQPAVIEKTPETPAETPVTAVTQPTTIETPVVEATAKAVAPKAVYRDLATAPSAVLELVNQHPGKVIMVGFFSPNCRDCKPSLAWLNEMRRKYWAQGLQVIGVNLGTQAQAKKYLQDAPVSFEIMHDPDRKLASAFWLAEQPSTYLVSASGKLLSMHQGHYPSRIGEYEDSIRTALEQR